VVIDRVVEGIPGPFIARPQAAARPPVIEVPRCEGGHQGSLPRHNGVDPLRWTRVPEAPGPADDRLPRIAGSRASPGVGMERDRGNKEPECRHVADQRGPPAVARVVTTHPVAPNGQDESDDEEPSSNDDENQRERRQPRLRRLVPLAPVRGTGPGASRNTAMIDASGESSSAPMRTEPARSTRLADGAIARR